MRNRLIFASIVLFAAYTLASRADYTATQGVGTNFGSTVSGGVHYSQFNACDPTTPAQCLAVDASGRLTLIPNTSINNAQINGVTPLMGNGVTGTGSQRVTIANDNTIPTGWPTAAGLSQINTTLGSPFQAGGSIGNTTFAVTNAGTFATQAQPTPVTTGGLTWYFVQPAASDNHVVIKAGAGQVYNIQVTNNSATVNYLRLYNATTGFNGCNSATNIVGQWAIPASTSVGGLSISIPLGIAFSTGISICVTSGYATTDTTNATATAMSVNVGYK